MSYNIRRLNFTDALPLLGDEFAHEPCYVDLSEDGPHIGAVRGLSQRELDKYIKKIQAEHGVAWSLSGERESRMAMYRAFGLTETYIHIGLDINVPAGTPLFAPFDCTVVAKGYDTRDGGGGFGGNLTLKVENYGETFYLMFGHLAKNIACSIGDKIKGGEHFATTGDFDENGEWFHHTHMQVLTEKAFAENLIWGFVKKSDYPNVDEYSPSPMPIIQAVWKRR
jgi:murein DD-endopeptidase MepM/ murein hydrolase activator NlpD